MTTLTHQNDLTNQYRSSRHNEGFSIHYYHSDIPTHDSFLAEATCEALAYRTDLQHPICVEVIAQITEEMAAELQVNLVGRG